MVMDCTVKADPAPSIVWYREGKVVEKSSKVSITIEKKGELHYIRLELKDPSKDDSGLYKCNIKNQFGELNANLTLNIESKYCFEVLLSLIVNVTISGLMLKKFYKTMLPALRAKYALLLRLELVTKVLLYFNRSLLKDLEFRWCS